MKDESYTFENLLPYFKKSVMFTPPDYGKRGGPTVAYDPSAFTHSGGPLKVAYWNYYIPVSQYFRRGLLRLGFKENGGIESGSLLGLTQYPATLNPHSQTRDSSETSFLRQAIANTGLQVYQRTLAKRIIFDGKTAVGAVVETAGVSYTLFARKEVVLAAGQVSQTRDPSLRSRDSNFNDNIVSIAATTHGIGYWTGRNSEKIEHSNCRQSSWSGTEHLGMYLSATISTHFLDQQNAFFSLSILTLVYSLDLDYQKSLLEFSSRSIQSPCILIPS